MKITCYNSDILVSVPLLPDQFSDLRCNIQSLISRPVCSHELYTVRRSIYLLMRVSEYVPLKCRKTWIIPESVWDLPLSAHHYIVQDVNVNICRSLTYSRYGLLRQPEQFIFLWFCESYPVRIYVKCKCYTCSMTHKLCYQFHLHRGKPCKSVKIHMTLRYKLRLFNICS